MDDGHSWRCEESSKRELRRLCYLSCTDFKSLCKDLNVFLKGIEHFFMSYKIMKIAIYI